MRIKEMHVYQRDLPVRGEPYRMSRTQVTSLDSTIVEVVTDTGISGFGETCPTGAVYQPQHALGARAALGEMGPHLIGAPALAGLVQARMDGSLNGGRYAKAAVDIAMWDIAGKACGARVCDLLGGAFVDSVPTYFSISVGEPGEAARIAAERQKEGYRRLQMKVGGRPIEEDIETIRKTAEIVEPGVKLVVDANRGWTTRDVISVSRLCSDLNFIIEQPCDTIEEVAAVRNIVQHPIYLDECTENLGVVIRAAANGLCDGFGLKLTRLGGLSTLRTVRDICESRNLPHTCDDTWGGDIIAAACVHIGATVQPRLCDGVWIAAPYIDGHYDEKNGIEIEGGRIKVPTGPGLGVVPDRSVLGSPVMSFS